MVQKSLLLLSAEVGAVYPASGEAEGQVNPMKHSNPKATAFSILHTIGKAYREPTKSAWFYVSILAGNQGRPQCE